MKHVELQRENIKALLLGEGIRPTMHRIKIAHFVMNNKSHPTAEDVWNWASKTLAAISKGTVYNTLNELSAVGLVREFRFPHSAKTVYDCNTESHYHLLDSESGELMDISPDKVVVDTAKLSEFEINDMDILFIGRKRQATELSDAKG